MDIKAQIQSDRIAAMKAGETERKATLDYILGEIQKKEKDPHTKADIAAAVISAYIKSLREFIELHKQDRPEVCAKYETEIAMLLEYLPRQLSEEELIREIQSLVAGGTGKKGLIMKVLKEKHGAAVDGRMAATLLDRMGIR